MTQIPFKILAEPIQDYEKNEIVIEGDFNLVLNVEKDKKGGLPKTNNNARKMDL